MKKCEKFPNKNRYNTQKDAETAILVQQYALFRKTRLRCYHCDVCDGWHLSSKTKEEFDNLKK